MFFKVIGVNFAVQSQQIVIARLHRSYYDAEKLNQLVVQKNRPT